MLIAALYFCEDLFGSEVLSKYLFSPLTAGPVFLLAVWAWVVLFGGQRESRWSGQQLKLLAQCSLNLVLPKWDEIGHFL